MFSAGLDADVVVVLFACIEHAFVDAELGVDMKKSVMC